MVAANMVVGVLVWEVVEVVEVVGLVRMGSRESTSVFYILLWLFMFVNGRCFLGSTAIAIDLISDVGCFAKMRVNAIVNFGGFGLFGCFMCYSSIRSWE